LGGSSSQGTNRQTVLLAVSRGLVAPERLERVMRTPRPAQGPRLAPAWDEVLDTLIREGVVTEDTAAALTAEVKRRAGELQRATSGKEPASAPRALDGPSSRPQLVTGQTTSSSTSNLSGWKRFQVISKLGEGGMGEVFKAFDPTLRRYVAVKILIGQEEETVERFLREARAQARLHHPNICPVWEVGEVDGSRYIAMQFIDGETLDHAAARMSLEQKVRVMRSVAEAVHAAHLAGLIHRDLKPSNIIVERHEDGSFMPFVLDFGLVRDAEVGELTLTGAVIGTPPYMAPEQARGQLDRIDRRTDVYSLGCVLYELLGGRPPFVASSGLEVLVKMLAEEPKPLREVSPDLDPDLQTITLKCLEKAPARRYESAGALAEDLRRYLDGEPILARRASAAYRLGRMLTRHRVAATLVGLAVAVAVGAGSFALATLVRSREQAAAARRFGEQIKDIEGLVRTSALLPLHDTGREMAVVEQRLLEIERQAARLGRTARGPGQYALGRGALAMRRYAKARFHLETAWQAGYREPEVAFSLGLALSGLYQQALDSAQRAPIKELRDDMVRRAEAALRVPALGYLKIGAGAAGESLDHAEGLIALLEGRHQDALDGARRAFRLAPWSYEAKKLEGDVLVTTSTEAQDRGEYTTAAQKLAEAGEAYAQGLAIARSDSGLYLSECSRQIREMDLDMRRGSSPSLAYARGIEACGRALQAGAHDGGPNTLQAHLHWQYSGYLGRHGGDSAPTIAAALTAGAEAVRAAPRDPEAHLELGLAQWTLAEAANDGGDDPLPSLGQARQSFEAAVALDPNSVLAYNSLGLTWYLRAEHEASHNFDPRNSLMRSVSAFDRALALDPNFVRALNNQGIALQAQAEYEVRRGFEASASLAAAIHAYRKAAALDPRLTPVRANLATALWAGADLAINRGDDPIPLLDEAIASVHEVLAIDPRDANALSNLAGALVTRARWLLEQDRSPGADFDAAREALERTRALKPDDPTCSYTRAALTMLEARWEIRQGHSPLALLRQTQETLRPLLQGDPSNVDALVLAAEVHWRRAAWWVNHGGSVGEDIRIGLELASRALSEEPGLADSLAVSGALRLVTAEAAPAAARPALAQRALADLEQAARNDAGVARRFRAELACARAAAAG